MPSPKQITANRRNARRSTGPKSPEGKSASSRNAITHGLLARDPIILGERYNDFAELQASLDADFQPAGESEEDLVRKMAIETALFDSHINDVLAGKRKDKDDQEKFPRSGRPPTHPKDPGRIPQNRNHFHDGTRNWLRFAPQP